MRKLSLVALALTCTALQAQDYWCLNRHLSFLIDYGYIRRQEVRNLRLVEDTSVQMFNPNAEPKKVLKTENLADRLGWESAIRGRVTYHCNACASIEALYTYFYPWQAMKTVKADGTLRFPFKDPTIGHDYQNADRVLGKYKTRLQNGELNYWGHLTPQRVNYFSFSWNLGFRTLNLKEKMVLAFTREWNTSFYSVKTQNDLYGAQLGAMLEVNPSCKWTWSFLVKGAAFVNVVRNTLSITDENNTIKLFGYRKNDWTDSYLIEGYGQLAYHWNSCTSMHFGYQGFLLTGVVLAPDQRDVSLSKRRIKDEGQIIIDGLYVGLSLSF